LEERSAGEMGGGSRIRATAGPAGGPFVHNMDATLRSLRRIEHNQSPRARLAGAFNFITLLPLPPFFTLPFMSSPSSSQPPPVLAARKKSTAKWIVLGVLLLVIAGAAAAIRARAGGAEVIAVTTDKAVVKTITQVVTATGKVQPEKEVKIAPEVSGEIIELPFKEGAQVKQGDLLVRIKPDNYKFQVEQQEASLAATKASAADSRARLVKAEEDFKRNQGLYATKNISDAEYSAAVAAYESAKAGYESSLASINRAEGSLSQAKDQLAKTVIYSPLDGKISSLTNQVGERVAGTGSYGGADVMRVADLDHMELRVKVNENDIVNVKPGNHATISIDAFPGRKFNGSVTEISNSATAGAQGSDDVTNFQVKIAVTDRNVTLRPGMSATADIETQTVTNVTAVPIQSVTVRAGMLTSEELQQQQAKAAKDKTGDVLDAAAEKEQARRERDKLQRVVFVKQGDTVKLVTVETGIADLTHIEVKRGLKAGDEVVSGSYAAISRRLKDGSKVRIEQPAATPAAK
jgi:HlyD family secretion protein